MARFADVALPVAVAKEFTYRIPPDLEAFALPGARAVVPFGAKKSTGLIVATRAESPVRDVKSLDDVIDPSPILPEELLLLCRWIAEYYIAPLGEVLKAAMPHGFASASRRLIRLAPGTPERAPAAEKKRASARLRILNLLAERGPMLSTELGKATGVRGIDRVLNAMARGGLIASEEFLRHAAPKARTEQIILLSKINEQELASASERLSPRKKSARRLLEIVQEAAGGSDEISSAELLRRSGSSSGVLNGFVANGLLPAVRRERSRPGNNEAGPPPSQIVLNAHQQKALQAITSALSAGKGGTFLLHGVTGSGKTQVYIEAIRQALRGGKSAIVLVPEISLTPQIVQRFKAHFGEQAAPVHSRMAAGERHEVWRRAYSGTCRIVIGPRSAVFAPLRNIGLIVVDEEHESSYKQFDANPRYHARDVAIVRGSHAGAVVILGSATPSVESYANALSGKYTLLEMPNRIDNVPMPQIALVDMVAERKRAYAALRESLPEDRRRALHDFQQPAISGLLRGKIEDRLSRHEGIILLQNRRGFAPFVECPDCGFTEMCDRCNVSLTYHLAQKHLRCHYCGLIRPPRSTCPECGGNQLQLHGIGTQRVEEELAATFPDARVLRMDLDTTTRKGSHGRLLQKFGDREADILLGTQMVAKGLDFPHVTLVGVVSADTQMLLPDFRASERTFQLLTQVAGRAGRSVLHGEVVIQTHQPAHPALRHVIQHDFASFYGEELRAREELGYPPFSRIVLVETRGKDEQKVRTAAERLSTLLEQGDGTYTRLGPAPAVIARVNNQYRWHIVLKNMKNRDPGGSRLRAVLHGIITENERTLPHGVRLAIDVDPVGLM